MSTRLNALNANLQAGAQAQGGFLPFEAFMNLALYAPNLGYYASTAPVGTPQQGGDFTTAPQISSLFGHTIAQALAPMFEAGLPLNLLECGAGTGKLAADVLSHLQTLGFSPVRYFILEVSASLRQQQQETLKEFPNVEWLDALPDGFEGVVLGNELLDAMPVEAYELNQSPQGPIIQERGVVWQPAHAKWQWASQALSTHAQEQLFSILPEETAMQDAYQFEVCSQAHAWVRSMAERMKRGLVLLIDYGFPQAELYHPQRAGGTLMAHHRHQATADVLANVGAADITAHVNFTAVAQAGELGGLQLMGYTSQARFLVNADIAAAYERAAITATTTEQAQLSRGLQYLISEAEMGELFKVIALGKDCVAPLGFERGDRSQRLNHAV